MELEIEICKRLYRRTICCKRNKIRQNDKEEGKILIEKFHAKKPRSLEYFLKIMNITEDEFMKIALKHQISPWKYDESLVSKG